jgi:hypothetical protein
MKSPLGDYRGVKLPQGITLNPKRGSMGEFPLAVRDVSRLHLQIE